AVLKELEPRAMLTVGDNPAFIRAGGMIRFFSEDSRIRLQINPEAARSSGLMISSKLLRLADISIPKAGGYVAGSASNKMETDGGHAGDQRCGRTTYPGSFPYVRVFPPPQDRCLRPVESRSYCGHQQHGGTRVR